MEHADSLISTDADLGWLTEPGRVEPKWTHGKKAIVEPDRKLTAEELKQRVCDHFGCPLEPALPKSQP